MSDYTEIGTYITYYGATSLSTIISALCDAHKRINELEKQLKALDAAQNYKHQAIDNALHELGSPTPEYPAPVANAVNILTKAISHSRK